VKAKQPYNSEKENMNLTPLMRVRLVQEPKIAGTIQEIYHHRFFKVRWDDGIKRGNIKRKDLCRVDNAHEPEIANDPIYW
jgi:hypothetical protein